MSGQGPGKPIVLRFCNTIFIQNLLSFWRKESKQIWVTWNTSWKKWHLQQKRNIRRKNIRSSWPLAIELFAAMSIGRLHQVFQSKCFSTLLMLRNTTCSLPQESYFQFKIYVSLILNFPTWVAGWVARRCRGNNGLERQMFLCFVFIFLYLPSKHDMSCMWTGIFWEQLQILGILLHNRLIKRTWDWQNCVSIAHRKA